MSIEKKLRASEQAETMDRAIWQAAPAELLESDGPPLATLQPVGVDDGTFEAEGGICEPASAVDVASGSRILDIV